MKKYLSAFTIVVLWGKRGGPAPALRGGGHIIEEAPSMQVTRQVVVKKDFSAFTIAIAVLWGKRGGPVPALRGGGHIIK